MTVIALVFAGIAAMVHVYIFSLESLTWTHSRTRAIFRMSDDEARTTRVLAFNQGFYNLFLALATSLGIAFVLLGDIAVGATLVFVGTGSMVAAALVLIVSSRRMLRAALLQGVAPALAIIFLAVSLLTDP